MRRPPVTPPTDRKQFEGDLAARRAAALESLTAGAPMPRAQPPPTPVEADGEAATASTDAAESQAAPEFAKKED